MRTGSTLLIAALAEAWQLALAAEHQAGFGYAIVGPHLESDAASRLARACQAAHETLRDATSIAITAAGAAPIAPASDYPSLYPVSDAPAALLLALRLETDAATAWRYLYAVAAAASGARSASARTTAQAALTASAVRATGWRLLMDPAAATVAFPGI